MSCLGRSLPIPVGPQDVMLGSRSQQERRCPPGYEGQAEPHLSHRPVLFRLSARRCRCKGRPQDRDRKSPGRYPAMAHQTLPKSFPTCLGHHCLGQPQ